MTEALGSLRLMVARGFTLIEALLVLGVVGFLVAITIPVFERYIEKSRIVEATVTLGEISRKVKQHEIAKGALPGSLADVGYGGKVDPWGRPYEYFNLRAATGNGQARKDKKLAPLNSEFDLYSIGRDGVTHRNLSNDASRDDVVRARDGGFVGLAQDFDP